MTTTMMISLRRDNAKSTSVYVAIDGKAAAADCEQSLVAPLNDDDDDDDDTVQKITDWTCE